ncbi:MAG: hypothetical protein KBD94_09915 [Pyrinomonadaceae bacterium]|nr:hypothetical protein [Pyrinomonadaceae bacterium]
MSPTVISARFRFSEVSICGNIFCSMLVAQASLEATVKLAIAKYEGEVRAIVVANSVVVRFGFRF